ncbi:MAG TPA: VCBS repeat-containing protein, partial [Micrococcaceae bacterium]
GLYYYYPNTTGGALGGRTEIGSGWESLTTMALDFDGDGAMDILARNPAGQLLLYRSNGLGQFTNEPRKVVNVGWAAMTHLSAVNNHLGDGRPGLLARDGAGNLYLYPVGKSVINYPRTIGRGGWDTLLLGS